MEEIPEKIPDEAVERILEKNAKISFEKSQEDFWDKCMEEIQIEIQERFPK